MKKYLIFLGLIFIISLVMISCKKSPEDACNCMKEAANTYILEGYETKSVDDIREPCLKLIEKFQDDANARILIENCWDEIQIAVKDKTLLKVEGKIPKIPEYTFKTINDYEKAVNSTNGHYKYWKTKVVIDEAYLTKFFTNITMFDNNDNLPDYLAAATSTQFHTLGNIVVLRIPKNIVDHKLYSQPICLEENYIFDTQDLEYIDNPFSESYNATKYMCHLMDRNLPLFTPVYNYGQNKYELYEYDKNLMDNPNNFEEIGGLTKFYTSRINYTIKNTKYKNLVYDLRNGRFKYITKEEFEKVAGKGNNAISLTKAKIYGEIYEDGVGELSIIVSKIENIKKIEVPPFFKQPGKSYEMEGKSLKF